MLLSWRTIAAYTVIMKCNDCIFKTIPCQMLLFKCEQNTSFTFKLHVHSAGPYAAILNVKDGKESVRQRVARIHQDGCWKEINFLEATGDKIQFFHAKIQLWDLYFSDIAGMESSKYKAQRKTKTSSISIKVCKKQRDNLKAICQHNSKTGTVADSSEEADSCILNKWEALKKNCWQLC